MTDRQGLSWQQTFFMRVINLSTARWFLSLWTVVKRAPCRRCSHRVPSRADLRACCRWRTPGWRFQWSLRCGSCRWRWAHNLWEDSCRPKCLTPHSRKRTVVFVPEPTHMEDEDEDQENEKGRWKRRWRVQNGESKRIKTTTPCGWYKDDVRARHLEPVSCATLKWVLWMTRKCDVWGCSVHTSRRLQQIAISCKRSDYNKL